jgi:tryptophan synthase beta chain
VLFKKIKEQLLKKKVVKPRLCVACVGGGSNAAGTYCHFLDNEDVNIIAVEAAGFGS